MRACLTLSSFILAMIVVSGTIAAAPITYNLAFTGSTRAISGFFTYDPAAGFSNFLVTWDGATYDLTASANAPTLGTANTCTGRASTAAYGFFMMQQLTTGCGAGTSYEWNGGNTGSSSVFEFLQFPPAGGFGGDKIFQTTSFGDGFGVGNQGGYSITTAAPEPASWTFAFALIGLSAYGHRRSKTP